MVVFPSTCHFRFIFFLYKRYISQKSHLLNENSSKDDELKIKKPQVIQEEQNIEHSTICGVKNSLVFFILSLYTNSETVNVTGQSWKLHNTAWIS